MSNDIEADYIEQVNLTPKQQRYVEEWMTNGFDKKAAFFAAGYTCSNLDRLNIRIAKVHTHPLVEAEIRNQQRKNQTSLQQRYSPLDVMFANLDHWFNRALDTSLEEGDRNRARAEAQAIAVHAAPYVHPKLQAIQIKTIAEKDLNDYTDDELDITIARIEQALQIGNVAPPSQGSSGKKTH